MSPKAQKHVSGPAILKQMFTILLSLFILTVESEKYQVIIQKGRPFTSYVATEAVEDVMLKVKVILLPALGLRLQKL